MAQNRIDLQYLLEQLLGSRNVYYQPPESIKMSYPAIVYKKSNIRSRYANNSSYSLSYAYELIVIDKHPDNPVIETLLQLPYCSFSTHYAADGLNHDVLTLYY